MKILNKDIISQEKLLDSLVDNCVLNEMYTLYMGGSNEKGNSSIIQVVPQVKGLN